MARKTALLPPGGATWNFAGSKAGVVFDAGPGNDWVLGSRHADAFKGGEGHDALSGKAGDDTLQGGPGLDAVAGGAGSDTFVFAQGDLIASRAFSNGHKGQVDGVLDFQGAGTGGPGEQDVIRLEGFGAGTTLEFAGTVGLGRGVQLYEVVDPTTSGADGFILVSMADGSRAKLTADDYVVEPGEVLRITNITEGGSGSSYFPSFSADGSTVAFSGDATNLVGGQADQNQSTDIFIHDVATGETVNVTQGGNLSSFGASLSADGSTLAFSSSADNLIEGQGDGNYGPDIFIYDVATGELVNLSLGIGYGGSYSPSLSADGSTVAFNLDDDGGGVEDVFVMGTATSAQDGGAWIKVTEGGNGSSYASSLSADGATVAFESAATNLVDGEFDRNDQTDIFVHDIAAGETINVTQGANGGSFGPSLSADGSTVAFTSYATNLVDGQTDGNDSVGDVFVHDVATGETINVTEGGDGGSFGASISADGSKVAFSSRATNLVDGEVDQNGSFADIFVFDVATGETVNVTQGRNAESFFPSISADGSTGVFTGVAEDGATTDAFVWDWT